MNNLLWAVRNSANVFCLPLDGIFAIHWIYENFKEIWRLWDITLFDFA